MKVFCRDSLYIPIHRVNDEQYERVEKKFEREVFKDEKTCEQCDYFSERPCDICTDCPNYEGKVKMHSIVKKDSGKKFLRLPFGSRTAVEKIFGPVTFVNKNEDVPMKKAIEFTGELREDQVRATKKMFNAEFGVLKSPPRSGKTVMCAYLVCKLSQKTLILASQKDWLDNFHETFVGSETQTPLTNIKGKRIGFPKTLADFEKYDICLVTYQKFLSAKGKKLLKAISKMFGILLIDEVQAVGAKEFATVVSKIHTRYKIGVSGTPQRKDCVSGNTLIHTPRGPIQIQELKTGETVTTSTGIRTILETHIRKKAKMLRVEYEGGYLDCTPDHKIWSNTRQCWVKAKDLTTEDELDEIGFYK